MSEENKEKEQLKVLRVNNLAHQNAKINSAKRGIKLQQYIEQLIEKDEKGMINWD